MNLIEIPDIVCAEYCFKLRIGYLSYLSKKDSNVVCEIQWFCLLGVEKVSLKSELHCMFWNVWGKKVSASETKSCEICKQTKLI